ncbi:epoxide hydrolase family protein [Intrasporangium sp.]|uniref:epoxide hydrolase family protein n=1 Tax=Intrasporangium sp. TaxID=1925024 RepID=UPI0029396183|nr:alpha/beta fold hydrolase [Intrasporangium sp.]MDV3222261.1 epoxide hydrolase 1 [Intrasporangium sp.]
MTRMNHHPLIRPFRIHVPQADLDDLRHRLAATRWPSSPAEPSSTSDTSSPSRPASPNDWSRGVPEDYLRELADYWADGYDWRAQEAALNELPQFVTEIDGQTIHFFHVCSPEPAAVPLLITHGWPSSPVEFTRLVGPLADPRSHGGDPDDAFDLVIPALPGYGFSTPLGPGGFNLFAVAQAWTELMSRLGYERFATQGTDVGSGVAGMIAMVAPHRVIGVHLTGTAAAAPFEPALDADAFVGDDRDRAQRHNAFREDGSGYLAIMSTRPQTLAYGLTDSPVAQLAWIAEKFHEWTDPAHERPHEAVDKDQLLTNVSIYWFTRSGASTAHAVHDGMRAWREYRAAASEGSRDSEDSEDPGGDRDGEQPPAGPPTGVAVFRADTTIRALMDPAGSTAHWAEYDRGGHFPAMEVPDLLIEDLRTFFRPLR